MTEFHLYLNRHLFRADDYVGTYQPLTNTVSLRAEFATLAADPYFKGATVLIAGVDPNPAPRKAGRPKKISPE